MAISLPSSSTSNSHLLAEIYSMCIWVWKADYVAE